MHYYQIIPTKIFRQNLNPSDDLLTYSSHEILFPGQLVLIPLGKTTISGIVFNSVTPPENSPYQIKPIHQVFDLPLIPSHLLDSIFWLSHYYLSPLPTVANLLIPKGLTKKRRTKSSLHPSNTPTSPPNPQSIPLNSAQKTALKELSSVNSHTKLLHGVTGSAEFR